uniref:Reverse transcriptase domain-containing protein n=1 Tax=Cannabis sativa TaxID=3483 RepID=A0A803QFQ7_CANSA
MGCIENGKRLDLAQQLKLIQPFSSKEIKEELFSIPSSKSPGPNGFNSEFFKVMWKEIGSEGAFIKNRSIAHNILMFQDLFKNYGRKLISLRCAIKIDLSKAYDIVDWGFLEDLLEALNFPSKFVMWIMTCLKGTSYMLMMNGRLQGNFKGKKALRQGDPMSPLLFVLIMEYLTRRLRMETTKKTFRFHPLCKNLNSVSHFFADDLILFSKDTLSAIVDPNTKEDILMALQFVKGTFPLRYVGVPLRPTNWRREDCEAILKKIKMRLLLEESLTGLGLKFGLKPTRVAFVG